MISLPQKLSTFKKLKVNYSDWYRNFRSHLGRRQCLLCEGTHCHPTGICPPCLADLPWLEAPCRRCGIRLPPKSGAEVCARCQQDAFHFDRCIALFDYEFPVRELISEYKFRRKTWFGRPLGWLLADRIRTHYGCQPPDLLMATPLQQQRLRERGFNQAQELGRIVSRNTGIPLETGTLVKSRATPQQSSLDARERARNLRNSFEARRSFPGLHLLLIDDIVTTGHTASEISKTLKRAGAARVDVFCVARTPPPE